MTKIQLHEDCKILSQAVYGNNLGKTINGWECIDAQSYENGYYVEAYKKGNQIIMVSRGTEPSSKKDLLNDLEMGVDKLPNQLNSAKEFYSKIKEKYGKDNDIIFTGHSLGGSISQTLGSETGNETVTFSAYGVQDSYSPNLKYRENITNYGKEKDGVFMSNIDKQIGKTVILDSKNNKSEYVTNSNEIDFVLPKDVKEAHKLESYGNLSNGVEYKQTYPHNGTPLFKMGIEENVDLSKNDNINKDYKPNNVLKYGGLDKIQQPLSIEKSKEVQPQEGIFQKSISNPLTPQQNNNGLNNELNIDNFEKKNDLFSQPNNSLLMPKSESNPINTGSTTFDDLLKKYGINKTLNPTIFSHLPTNTSTFTPTSKQNIRDLIRQQSQQNDGVDISDFRTISRSFGSDDNPKALSDKRFQDLDLEELMKRLWRFV